MNIIAATAALRANRKLYMTSPRYRNVLDARAVGFYVLLLDGSWKFGHTQMGGLRCASFTADDMQDLEWEVIERL